ncbi:MAG: photosystem I reaction center subunit PsaK [Oscillatoriales cyanobacterium SM2_1_8]|nr:photosystem I reaction center subunit PsaK [Oscillatoriales cyanobacterium SM2_1_8]
MELATILAAVPATAAWSPKVAAIFILCNLFAVAIGRYAIQKKGVGPALPVAVPGLFTGFGVPELLATTSLGHLLAAGMTLGLAQAGLM